MSEATANKKNYITPGGLKRLQEELRHLRDQERPQVVRTVAWAASNGDRSENADYIYGKRRLREIDKRIGFLKKRLESVELVDPEKQKSNRVLFGATVKVLTEQGEKVFSIVGADEVDIAKGHISWISPLGSSLLGKEKGESFLYRAPKGEEELEVLEITYQKLVE